MKGLITGAGVVGSHHASRLQSSAEVRVLENLRIGLASRPLRIHGDGGQTRDIVAVEDIAGALDFVASQLVLTGSTSPIEFTAPRAGGVRRSGAGTTKLRHSG